MKAVCKKIISTLKQHHHVTSGLVMMFVCAGLFFLPSHSAQNSSDGTKSKARVLSIDNSRVQNLGLLLQGEQQLEIEILSGKHKGKRFPACNQLRAQMELDKMFEPGDIILAGIIDGAVPGVTTVRAQDHYRISWSLVLFALFALLLVIFGGVTGANALLSFVFSCLFIWKVLVPALLAGCSALVMSFVTVMLLSCVIIVLVSGFTLKALTALSGTLLGVLSSCAMAYIFSGIFKINGAVMPYSQALLYSGFGNISLSEIYIGAIFLSSSGAVMDLAMDVASSMHEVVLKSEKNSFSELFKSGLRVGRSVVGTMTTTLLLAYSGGYLTLMMMFCAEGVLPTDFINNPHVASEMVKTLIGSFGLVLVAPFTALSGAWLYSRKSNNKRLCER
ncbi:MAG: YibE/F family protein [Lentisphaeria bacterium]|nr:YibE/F family protein [Lentisphaeria bacterium]